MIQNQKLEITNQAKYEKRRNREKEEKDKIFRSNFGDDFLNFEDNDLKKPNNKPIDLNEVKESGGLSFEWDSPSPQNKNKYTNNSKISVFDDYNDHMKTKKGEIMIGDDKLYKFVNPTEVNEGYIKKKNMEDLENKMKFNQLNMQNFDSGVISR